MSMGHVPQPSQKKVLPWKNIGICTLYVFAKSLDRLKVWGMILKNLCPREKFMPLQCPLLKIPATPPSHTGLGVRAMTYNPRSVTHIDDHQGCQKLIWLEEIDLSCLYQYFEHVSSFWHFSCQKVQIWHLYNWFGRTKLANHAYISIFGLAVLHGLPVSWMWTIFPIISTRTQNMLMFQPVLSNSERSNFEFCIF